MSYKLYTVSSTCRDPFNRSRKLCVCGGHNHTNVKRNLNHHSTKIRLQIRRARRTLLKLREITC